MERVEIRIRGRLDPSWQHWFDGLDVSCPNPDETLLSGLLTDQSALYGIIARIRNLGIELVSVVTTREDE